MPTKDGLYNVEPMKYQIHFISENEKCKKEWLQRIAVWHEEKYDYSDDVLDLLNEMYSDLEVPSKYSKGIRNLIKKLTN